MAFNPQNPDYHIVSGDKNVAPRSRPMILVLGLHSFPLSGRLKCRRTRLLSRDVKVDWYCFELRTIDSQREGEEMRPGDLLKTSKPIRSQKTGVVLPREGTFVRAIENMGRQLILVNFGAAGDEYLFPEEILLEPARS
jgi:hypothetical protein